MNNKFRLSEQPANTSTALKAAAAIIGIGLAAGFALVIGVNKIMKDLFVNEEWSSDDWADEDLD